MLCRMTGDSTNGEEAPACLNCGTQLGGAFCPACGQQAHLHKTIGGFVHDLLHGVLHFEGRIWRTLPLLAWQPGRLTRAYIDGQRVRHVSPMALFLFSVFLMFAVFQLAGLSTPVELDVNVPAPVEAGTVLEPAGQSNVPLLNHLAEKWRANPSLMLYKLQASSYKFSWLLIPLSLPFMALLFAWKRRFGLYDHAVFVTYSLSFMTMLAVALVLLGQIGVGSAVLGTAGMVIPFWHIHRQMRGTYALGRWSALWRTVVLCGIIVVVLTVFLNLLVLLGAF